VRKPLSYVTTRAGRAGEILSEARGKRLAQLILGERTADSRGAAKLLYRSRATSGEYRTLAVTLWHDDRLKQHNFVPSCASARRANVIAVTAEGRGG